MRMTDIGVEDSNRLQGFCEGLGLIVKNTTENALRRIGIYADLKVVVVGLSNRDPNYRVHSLVGESFAQDDHISSVVGQSIHDLMSVTGRSKDQDSPSSSGAFRGSQQQLKPWVDALSDQIQRTPIFEDYSLHTIGSRTLHHYIYVVGIGIPNDLFEVSFATGETTYQKGITRKSFSFEIISECLRRTDKAYHQPIIGRDPFTLGTTDEIVRTAAGLYLDYLTRLAVKLPVDLFHAVEKFVSKSYEKSGASGRLIVLNTETADTQLGIELRQPISIHDDRTIRKLLQLCEGTKALLATSEKESGTDMFVFGVGTCEPGPDVVEIDVKGHAEWEVSVDNTALLRVTYGHATIPDPLLSTDLLSAIAHKIFDSINVSRIANIVQAARNCGHGMLIVISSSPEEEAQRLRRQAMRIAPKVLLPEEIVTLGKVDGAVLLGPDGLCHAFGVILDGIASGNAGNLSRGSRYNSAIRYENTVSHKSLLVVISDDGMVDLVPSWSG